MKNYIDYGALIKEAMCSVVKKTVGHAAENGFQGNHHFFISFLTQHNGVILSQKLLAAYPREMVIVLQYQFENLRVIDSGFFVDINFDHGNEHIFIPFKSILMFADPSVSFMLQFETYNIEIGDRGSFFDEEESNTDECALKENNVISFMDYKKSN